MSSTQTQVAVSRLRVPVGGGDHVRGRTDAPVTLVEYGDFQCPHCGAAYENVHEVLRQRPDRVRVVFRHFPVTNLHPYAEVAAETAEAGTDRDRFWQLHDWLFEHQDQIDPVHLSLGVQQVGLPADEVTREVTDHVHLDRVRGDFVGGIRSGVNGTPTFFVNGLRHDGPYALPDLLAAVDAAEEPDD
ncbi:thioredoxin domain-containing protein [Solwaraspora sp. WMMD1047]|uniref:DsbA family protein n=1 Tax=Solwaraspora sp. WMMD1047 TaxID=3016102 RepID=UPI0024168F0C|nr:thioredoxin domain-containing protein [Solwaraspora sp. WMMD1047]MDG4832581.1 thioredoxin domain-containing protein [Solwaraspora sp. WMMD1047]